MPDDKHVESTLIWYKLSESKRMDYWKDELDKFLKRKILRFYVIFYAALVAFFAPMLAVSCQTLDDTNPKWQMDKSLIASNPGLALRPMPDDKHVERILIWYKLSEPKSMQYWKEKLDKFLKPYLVDKRSDNVQTCDNNRPEENKVCDFRLPERDFIPCLPDYHYGYRGRRRIGPCIFLKLNKIFGWTPEYYNMSTIPHNMPKRLKDRIAEAIDEGSGGHRVVWVDCAGENPADIENVGPINYLPLRGFKDQYFPFLNVKGYLSPLVAVHFEDPKLGVLINVECKAWARNIINDRVIRRGSIHLALMVDQ